ncbi:MULTISPECIES: helix-turn-helix domain-containing protein [Rhodopseudomonas]|uniref:Transcriptional regulator n=1 Tax=Rhodopseudomonas palustris TaxID=1076 RepID=A0A0D7F3S1_RHOPL|nr:MULTISPECIES: helix-turn-helix domain-containing protein [Rhodopseudomonas]KIZ47699.1 transcriptional regulator [Rhodopseudomonas palustris]MDF3813334.1 helix-turn-helix domain-containing protein [Rhodopseudomonas sp. BAL398]WOK17201.1 helix-turn-helix domain-containing protein [Rhodopseudomonas sp. BAL398]
MPISDYEPIRSLPLFSGMAQPNFTKLMQASFLQRFPAQLVIIREGDSSDFLHVVIEGSIDFFAVHAGRETSLWIAQPYATFILAAVIRDQVYLHSARTLEISRILMIPAKAVHEAFDNDPAFAHATVLELAARYRDVVRDLKNIKLRPSLERLANWLLRRNISAGGQGRFEIPFDKRTLASHLGMTPENLSRNFASLQAYGVEINSRDITLNDIASLTRLAKPNRLIDDPES